MVVISIIIILLLNSFETRVDCPAKNPFPGFVITFDDAFIDEWFNSVDFFNDNNITPTFFISGFSYLDSTKKNKIKRLSDLGFEIGVHSLNHLDYFDYIKEHSVDNFYTDEIYPEIVSMEKYGINPRYFSFPYGFNDSELDTLSLKKFSLLRDITEYQRHFYTRLFTDLDRNDEIFFTPCTGRVIKALGVDKNFNLKINDIKECFVRAKKNNEIIVFYAHKPVNHAKNDYEIEYKYMSELFTLAKEMGIRACKLSDLDSISLKYSR
jgi:peptidoglycan/xylan/chitin deacetylase (PgdA/CDA1 family)